MFGKETEAKEEKEEGGSLEGWGCCTTVLAGGEVAAGDPGPSLHREAPQVHERGASTPEPFSGSIF